MSPAAATNTLLNSDLIDRRETAPSTQEMSGGAEVEGLGDLFRDNYKSIFGTAYRITGSPSDAEDVLQTIFLRLTPNAGRYDLSPNPQGYLHRAAVNASLDLLRRRKRANSVPLEVLDFDQNDKFSTASPEDDLADLELRDLIRQAVAKLGGRAAAAFALRYFDGLDNAQIAEVLGTSHVVVAVTLHRARVRLRKEIGSYLEKHHEAQ